MGKRKAIPGLPGAAAVAAQGERDTFPQDIVLLLAKRAAFICSNPHCRAHTIAPCDNDPSKVEYTGVAAHITAAANGGPRYDESLSSDQRKGAENGMFLCEVCASKIDKNKGIDYPVQLLRSWKTQHETRVKGNLNQRAYSEAEIEESVVTHVTEVKEMVRTIQDRQDLALPLHEFTVRLNFTGPVPLEQVGDFRLVVALFDPAVSGGDQIWIAARGVADDGPALIRTSWFHEPEEAHPTREALQQRTQGVSFSIDLYRQGPVETLLGFYRYRAVILLSDSFCRHFAGFELRANNHQLLAANAGHCMMHRVSLPVAVPDPRLTRGIRFADEEEETFLGHPPVQAVPVPWPARALGEVDPARWVFIGPLNGTYNPSRGERFFENALPNSSSTVRRHSDQKAWEITAPVPDSPENVVPRRLPFHRDCVAIS